MRREGFPYQPVLCCAVSDRGPGHLQQLSSIPVKKDQKVKTRNNFTQRELWLKNGFRVVLKMVLKL